MDKLCSLVEHLVRIHPEYVITRSKHRMVAVDACCSTKIKRAKTESVSWPYLEHFMYYHHNPAVHHLQCPLCFQGHTVGLREELWDYLLSLLMSPVSLCAVIDPRGTAQVCDGVCKAEM